MTINLQGEVEAISQMKPKSTNEHDEGLLEYLEDIIGTSQYKIRTEELALRVDELSEERDQKQTRVRVVEKEKSAMTPQKEEAEAFLVSENDLVVKRNQFLQLNIFEYRRHTDVLNDSSVSFIRIR